MYSVHYITPSMYSCTHACVLISSSDQSSDSFLDQTIPDRLWPTWFQVIRRHITALQRPSFPSRVDNVEVTMFDFVLPTTRRVNMIRSGTRFCS